VTRSISRPAIIYLARAADGLAAFKRLVDSSRRHDAGVEHDFVVIYKGFAVPTELGNARAVFKGLTYRGIELPDEGFDIGSYLEACRRLEQDVVCCLNTHSEISAPNWLGRLVAQLSLDSVGLVGPMGSYESLAATIPLIVRAINVAKDSSGRRNDALARYFDFVLPRFRPDWYDMTQAQRRGVGFARAVSDRILAWRRPPPAMIGPRGSALIWPGAPELDVSAFPPFPNPHIRSNGFATRRKRLLELDLVAIRSKEDANLFESGRNSLTAQVREAGLKTLVVGRDGVGYDVPDWSRSRTFRLGDQSNLLVEDNHTRAFTAMSHGAKVTHTRMSWGDYGSPPPTDFPDFGIRFAADPLILRRSSVERARA
jgi:hypothetical protein